MRNGNYYYRCEDYCCYSCSYPTYEEWKPNDLQKSFFHWTSFLSYLWGMETALLCFLLLSPCTFLSYLWGMETCWQLKQVQTYYRVLILPMRNGNFFIILNYFQLMFVLILPMRNGNIYILHHSRIHPYQFLSYLWGMETIYSIFLFVSQLNSSYPTYEEWKPITVLFRDPLKHFGSYPTYEEWKQLPS